MTGGVGSITGTLFGVFVICLLKTGLPFIGLTANWQQIIAGFVLIAAVLVDILREKQEKSNFFHLNLEFVKNHEKAIINCKTISNVCYIINACG